MKTIHWQITRGLPTPLTLLDADNYAAYNQENRIIKTDVYGVQRPRSLEELGTYWACCEYVAQNQEDPWLQTKENVDFHVKSELNWFDLDKVAVKNDGTVIISPKTISFDCDHQEMRAFFFRAFPYMASILGMDEFTLIEKVKEEMEKRKARIIQRHERTA